MAIYHLSVKTISRSAGRTATAAAAYRAGMKIEDEATGEIHDYRRKGGVESATLVLPAGAPEWASERGKLWNAAEGAEKRKNSTVAREFEISLPAELDTEQRKKLAIEFARQIVERHGCAADVAIHAPGKEGDNRNHHAHILLTTRRLTPEGFGGKTRELDDKKAGSELVKEWRGRFAMLQNAELQGAGHSARVDHRTLEEQGIDREPTKHLGIHATAIERRTGQPSRRRITHNEEASKRLAEAKAQGDLEREIHQLEVSVIDLSTDVQQAKSLAAKHAEVAQLDKLHGVDAGVADFMKQFEAHQTAERQRKLDAERLMQEQQRESERREATDREREAMREQAEEAKRQREEAVERARRRDNDRGMSM